MQTARLHGKAVLLCSGVDVARSATDCPLRKGAVAPALAAQPVGVRRGGSAVAARTLMRLFYWSIEFYSWELCMNRSACKRGA